MEKRKRNAQMVGPRENQQRCPEECSVWQALWNSRGLGIKGRDQVRAQTTENWQSPDNLIQNHDLK